MSKYTDKELLGFAAKAAGYDLTIEPAFGLTGRPMEVVNGVFWNPLADDGDALRLAEQCGLTICMNGKGTVSACDAYKQKDVFVTQSIQECGGSRITAIRKAIVRAAAIIGANLE